ncbi:MAG TPA: CinA family protein, partial [Prolixibacteraceae bacterium]|nr:CinA family protein [Prolixibacteraceae bacterium]
TTGISGPDGGTPDKPVGTIYIAVAGQKNTEVVKYRFGDNRERNIIRSSQTALQMLRRLILKEV